MSNNLIVKSYVVRDFNVILRQGRPEGMLARHRRLPP